MPIYEVNWLGRIYEADAASPEEAQKAVANLARIKQKSGEYPGAPLSAREELGAMGVGLSRLVTAPGRLITAAAEATGDENYSVAEYNNAVKDLEFRLMGDSEGARKLAGVTEVGAGAAIPVGAAAKAVSWWKSIWEGSKLGTVFGATFGASPEAKTAEEALRGTAVGAGTGAVAGGVLSGAAGAIPSLRNAFAKWMTRGTTESAANMAKMRASDVTKDIPVTLGQEFGNPLVISFEQNIAGWRAKNFQNAQLDEFGKAVDTISGKVGRAAPGASAIEAADKMSTAFNRTTGKLQGAASKAYGDGLARVEQMAAGDASRFPVPMTHFKAAVDNVVAENLGPAGANRWIEWLVPKDTPSRYQTMQAAAYIANVSRARAATGDGLSVVEIANLKKAANTLRSNLFIRPDTTDRAALARYRAGKNIADGIDADIAQFLSTQKGQGPAGAALKELDDLNKSYGEFKGALDKHRESYVGQAFGGGIPKNPEDAFNVLWRMEDAQQARAVRILKDVAPEAIAEIKAWKLTQAADKMRAQVVAGNTSAVDPGAFIREMTNGSNLFGRRLWSPKELTDIEGAIAAARVILTDHTLLARSLEPGRIAAAAASGSKPFVVIQLYNLLGRAGFERALWTQEGIKALKTLRYTYTKPTQTTIQALATLDAITAPPQQQQEQPQ